MRTKAMSPSVACGLSKLLYDLYLGMICLCWITTLPLATPVVTIFNWVEVFVIIPQDGFCAWKPMATYHVVGEAIIFVCPLAGTTFFNWRFSWHLFSCSVILCPLTITQNQHQLLRLMFQRRQMESSTKDRSWLGMGRAVPSSL